MNNSNLSYESSSSGIQILDEEEDEFYEPTDEEIYEYAEYLGMDVEADMELLWIAREGLKCKLPAEWRACKTQQGDIFQFNFNTQQTQWEHPRDEEWIALYQSEKLKLNQKASLANNKQMSNYNSSSENVSVNNSNSNNNSSKINSSKKASKVTNKFSLEPMDAVIGKSKSNSLKRLDEVTTENPTQSVERKRLDTAQEIISKSQMPSESELKALDMQKNKKIEMLEQQFESDVVQQQKKLEDKLNNKIKEIKHDLEKKYKSKNSNDDLLKKDLEEIESEYNSKIKSFRLQKEKDQNGLMNKIESQVDQYKIELKQFKYVSENKQKYELEKLESYESEKKNNVNSKVKEEEEKLIKSTPNFKSKGNEKLKSLEAKINELNNEIKKKDEKLSATRDELQNTKNNLDSMKIEISKMKDNLSETSGQLNIERSKAKMLSTQSSVVAADKQHTMNMNQTGSSNLNDNINQIQFNNERAYKAMDNDELHLLRDEVSRLKHQVNKISFHGSADDVETIKADLSIVRENKARLMGEKQKVQEQQKLLLADKDQFKVDYEAFKSTRSKSDDHQEKKEALAKIKSVLDAKITNVNSCINSLSDAESKLNEMERALDKRLRDEENDDISNLSVDMDEREPGQPQSLLHADSKLTSLQRHILEIPVVDQKDQIKMIDRDIKSRLSSNFSRKLMQTRSRSNRSQDKGAYGGGQGYSVHDALGRHKNWCGSVKNQISNILKNRTINRVQGNLI